MKSFECINCGIIFIDKEFCFYETNGEITVYCPNGCIIGTIYLPDICEIKDCCSDLNIVKKGD